MVALPRLGGLGSCWGAIRFGSVSRPGQVRHGRLVVGGLRSQWLTVVVSSCSVGPRGMQHETGRGRWTPGAGASSPSPRTGPGPPVSGDWAGRNLNLTRGGLSGSVAVALCANFNGGSLAGPLADWGHVPAGGSWRAPRRPTSHCLWYPAWISTYPQWQPISNGHRSLIVAAMQVAITLETSRLSALSCPTGAAASNFTLVLLAPCCVALRSASVL